MLEFTYGKSTPNVGRYKEEKDRDAIRCFNMISQMLRYGAMFPDEHRNFMNIQVAFKKFCYSRGYRFQLGADPKVWIRSTNEQILNVIVPEETNFIDPDSSDPTVAALSRDYIKLRERKKRKNKKKADG